MMEGSSRGGDTREQKLLLGDVRHQHRVVAIDDLTSRCRHLDHTDLVAGHRRGVGLAVDDLQRPQAESEDEEEDEEEDPHDPQTEIRARRFVFGRPDEGRRH